MNLMIGGPIQTKISQNQNWRAEQIHGRVSPMQGRNQFLVLTQVNVSFPNQMFSQHFQ